jgi:hypothetical protein
MPVLEHSTIEFLEHFKAFAARVFLYPQIEASPLLEARVGGRVVYLFDRTGPYSAVPGEALLIVNPMADTIESTVAQEADFRVLGISKIEGVGKVIGVEPNHVVLLARAPLVVGVLDDSWRKVKIGDWVKFSSLEPVHGFFVKSIRG